MEKTKQCCYCKETFVVKKNKCYGKHFERVKCCSRKCLYQYNKENNKKIFKYEKVICSICLKEYERIIGGYRKKLYCSNGCSRIARKINPYIPTEQHKKIISETRKKDWANNEVYKNVNSGRTKWISYFDKNNIEYRVQGKWEYKFLEWLDNNNMNFLVHSGSLTYYDHNNEKRIYLPDFFVKEWDCFVDVKNSYLFSLTKDKFSYIIRDNPDIKIKILLESDLYNLGIDLKNKIS